MDRTTSRRLRWAVPVVVAGAVVGGVQLSARASTAAPDLPAVSAHDLLVKAQQARVTQLSGTVRSTTSLGLPALPTGGAANWSSLVAGTQTLRVYGDGPQRQRVDLMGDLTQASVVHDGRTVWTWSSATRKVTRATLPDVPATADGANRPSRPPGSPADEVPLTPQQAADRVLAAITPSTTVTVGRAATVAGRDAYDLRLVPKDAASLVGRVDLYLDARTGMALRTVVVPRGSSVPAVDVGFTSLRLSAPAASTFRFTPPPGAAVRNLTLPTPTAGDRPRGKLHEVGRPDVRTYGSGWATVLQTTLPDAASSAGSVAAQGDAAGPLGAVLRAAQPVKGAFGSGKLLRTRLLTVLQTDDGRVFVGSVTPAELLRVAGTAASTPAR
ncbi:outer membrane lipoprotein carrier protein LolA [Angustibacter peucedani]